MDENETFCWFNQLSDDILLKILLYVPLTSWHNVSNVCQRFSNVCQDKEIFRNSYLQCAYGFSEQNLVEYLRAGCQYIQRLNLNHCYWFLSGILANAISKCRKIQELYLLDCRLTTKGLSKIVCSMDCLKTLMISVPNLLEFSNELNGNPVIQNAFKHLEHFGIHIRDETNGSAATSLQFHLSQQTTIIEYSPRLKTLCVIGTPGVGQKLSKRLIHPLIVKTDHLSNLKTMSINSTNDATSRLYFFGILVKSFDQPDAHFENLSVSGLDLAQAVKRSYFIRALKESCLTLKSLDLSKVHIDNLETSITIHEAPCLKYLNLADIRSESRCLELMASASRCTNLVSLNLKGATTSQRHWKKEELQGLHAVLENCPHLEHLNISGVHIHAHELGTSLVDVLISYDISAFKSLALSVCCVVSGKAEETDGASTSSSTATTFVRRPAGKRQRIARKPQTSTQTPQPSSSTAPDDVDLYTDDCLSALYKACPQLHSLEMINTGFTQSMVHCSAKSHSNNVSLCKVLHQFKDDNLRQVAQWTNLQYLQITGVPGVSDGRSLKAIADNCVHLQRLYLAYLGASNSPVMWESIKYFKHLKDLRIEQSWLRLDDRFFSLCLGCSSLQRLVVVSKNAKVDSRALETYVHKASSVYVIQLFTDMFLKECDRLHSVLQKRYSKERPGFQIVLEQLHHERLARVFEDMPFVHIDEILNLTSKVASKPAHTVF